MAHLTHEEMQGFRHAPIPSGSLIRADRHLAACAICRKEMLKQIQAPELIAQAAAIEEPLHIDYAQMAAYLDSRLGEAPRTEVELHLSICAQCEAELEDLRTFDQQISAELAISRRAGSIRQGWLRELYQAWMEFWHTPQRVGLAAAGVALGLVAFMMLAQKSNQAAISSAPHGLAAQVWRLSTAQPQFFYGAALLGVAGVAILIYAAFSRRGL
jgi:hypothetical protein